MFTLLQYYYRIPHMVVHEVDPECTPDQVPPWESPHRAICGACCTCEGDPLCPGIIQGVGVCVPQVTLVYPVLGIPMGVQGPCRKFRISLGVAEPMTDPLPEVMYLPHHPKAIGICIVTPNHAESMTIHTYLI